MLEAYSLTELAVDIKGRAYQVIPSSAVRDMRGSINRDR